MVKFVGMYDAYGNIGSGEDASQPFRYTGRRFDAETGLYYYRARYYSATLGRFMQTDPIGYEDNMNLYGYTANDPVNGIDPDGKKVEVAYHVVSFGRSHTSVRITPNDQKAYATDPRFNNVDTDGNRYAVLSAGPSGFISLGTLESDVNRSSDIGPQDGSVLVNQPSPYASENDFISALFDADSNFDDGALEYSLGAN